LAHDIFFNFLAFRESDFAVLAAEPPSRRARTKNPNTSASKTIDPVHARADEYSVPYMNIEKM
jgi:hypothetical protein